MSPTDSTLDTPQELVINTFEQDQASSKPLNPLISQQPIIQRQYQYPNLNQQQQHQQYQHQQAINYIPLPQFASSPSIFVAPQSWAPRQFQDANYLASGGASSANTPSELAAFMGTPVLQHISVSSAAAAAAAVASAAVAAAGNPTYPLTGISPNLLTSIPEAAGTSHYATHFPPLNAGAAALSPSSMAIPDFANYTTIMDDGSGSSSSSNNTHAHAFAPAIGSSAEQLSHETLASLGMYAGGCSMVEGQGAAMDIDAGLHSSQFIDMQHQQHLYATGATAIQSYPLVTNAGGASLGVNYVPFDMEAAARLSDVAEETSQETLGVQDELYGPGIDTLFLSSQDASGAQGGRQQMLSVNAHPQIAASGHTADERNQAAACSASPSPTLQECSSSPQSMSSDRRRSQKRKTMSRGQQVVFCRFLLDNPGCPFPKEADRPRLTVDRQLDKKRFYWWFSNQRHRSFECNLVEGKKQYTPRIQFYRMCLRLSVLSLEQVPCEFQDALQKRRK
ncbi:hypothetical protein GGI15_003470 [Coemansia interrupta]|uniref:Homeobox domain-containing protein n=1 Tax=Coemansia interrupta TaxID=1126814 RepID=A0A9W8LIJ6_9FUNG|nr:hypothetical protein GGI15_003470 [Coemansia interrupta]